MRSSRYPSICLSQSNVLLGYLYLDLYLLPTDQPSKHLPYTSIHAHHVSNPHPHPHPNPRYHCLVVVPGMYLILYHVDTCIRIRSHPRLYDFVLILIPTIIVEQSVSRARESPRLYPVFQLHLHPHHHVGLHTRRLHHCCYSRHGPTPTLDEFKSLSLSLSLSLL